MNLRPPRHSADFQSAVSPIFNRQASAASLVAEFDSVPGAPERPQVGNLRYSRSKICATWRCPLTVAKHSGSAR